MARSRKTTKPRPPKKDRIVKQIFDAGGFGPDEPGFFGVETESGKRHSIAELAERVLELPANTSANSTKPERPPEEHSARPSTLAAAAAFFAYLDAGELCEETMRPGTLARLVAEFAASEGIEDADLLNPAGSVMRDMAARSLRAIRKLRKRD